MATAGGFGATATIGGTSITKIIEIEFPEVETPDIDVTAHDASSGYTERMKPGTKKLTGPARIKKLWDDTLAAEIAIETHFGVATSAAFVLSDGGETFTFSGFVESIEQFMEQDEGYVGEIIILPTGAITFS
jgi:hypothetical protein